MGRLGFSSSSISIYHYEHIFRKPETSCAVKIPIQEPSTPPVWDRPDFNQQTLPGQEMGPSHQPILWEMRTCFCRYWWVTEEVGRHWRSVHLLYRSTVGWHHPIPSSCTAPVQGISFSLCWSSSCLPFSLSWWFSTAWGCASMISQAFLYSYT